MWGSGLINGLVITMRNMLRGPITVKYPYEKLELPERARWSVTPKYDDEGNHKCTACLTCVKTCPDHILDIDVTTAEDKSKHIDHFYYEVGACMMCGLCVEACPFDAIKMSHDYELAVTDPSGLKYELLTDTDAAKPKRAAAAAKPAAAPGPRSEHSAESVAAPAPRSEHPAGGAAAPGSRSEHSAGGADAEGVRAPAEDRERRDTGAADTEKRGDADA